MKPVATDKTRSAIIIAWGNPLRSDDGAGWHVAELLRPRLSQNVRLLQCHQLSPELANEIAGARLVLFIDASVEHAPGTIRFRQCITESSNSNAMTHGVTPSSLLSLSHHLYGARPRHALICSIGAASFAFGEQLSPIVARAADALSNRIAALLLPTAHEQEDGAAGQRQQDARGFGDSGGEVEEQVVAGLGDGEGATVGGIEERG